MPFPSGRELGYRGPALVVRSNDYNTSRKSAVTAAMITSNVRRAGPPGNVILPKREWGLPKICVVKASRLITIDESFLAEKAGPLEALDLKEVEPGYRPGVVSVESDGGRA